MDDCLDGDGFNCNEAATGDGCLKMGDDNCKATPKALALPCVFACFGSWACLKWAAGVCQECTKDERSNVSLDDLTLTGEEALGCITCPCLVAIAAVGSVAAIFTWIGSSVCCMVGGCLSCKEKRANAVTPGNSDQPEDSANA